MRSLGLVGVFLSLAASACGGQAKEPSDGSSGASGTSGSDACKTGKATYHDRRAALLKQAEATTCNVDADCAILSESNRCVVTCGTPLPAAAVNDLPSQLDTLAADQCGTCAPVPIPPCAPPGPLTCQQGKCIN